MVNDVSSIFLKKIMRKQGIVSETEGFLLSQIMMKTFKSERE